MMLNIEYSDNEFDSLNKDPGLFGLAFFWKLGETSEESPE